MHLARQQDPFLWLCECELWPQPVQVEIATEEDTCDNDEQLARDAALKVRDSWTLIRENLLRSVHPLYNDTWRAPENPVLDAAEFMQKISLSTIQVMDEGSLSLYFADGDLFAGHLIDILWTGEGEMYDATLAG